MPHIPLPKLRNVFNGRAMVTRTVQTGGKIKIQQDAAMAPMPDAAKAPKLPDEADKKALKAKLMAEVFRNL